MSTKLPCLSNQNKRNTKYIYYSTKIVCSLFKFIIIILIVIAIVVTVIVLIAIS